MEKIKERRAKLQEQGITENYSLKNYQNDEEYRERIKAKSRQYYHDKKNKTFNVVQNDRNDRDKNDHKNW
jgi:hypothetical protein